MSTTKSEAKVENWIKNLQNGNLKSKGISMENIDRMYRCLFVYSFGFYEMLYSIFEHA